MRRHLKSNRHARGGKSRRLVDRRTGEQVVAVAAEARRDAALHADHCTGQLRTDQRNRLRSPNAAVIQSCINCLSGLSDRHLQLVAPVETARRRQHRFAVETAYRVATADRQIIDVIQRIPGVLPVDARNVSKWLLRDRERHGQVRIEYRHLEAVCRTATGSKNVVLRTQAANALPIRQRAVELCPVEVVTVGQAEFNEGVVAPLLRDFRIFDVALAEATGQADIAGEYVVLTACKHSASLKSIVFELPLATNV